MKIKIPRPVRVALWLVFITSAGFAIFVLARYKKNPRKFSSEASLELRKMTRAAKTYYQVNGHYLVGKTGPTPAQPCCGLPDNRCPPTDAWTKDPLWKELEFRIDEDTRFHYSYESDGKTFKATAVGDLDCDGTSATWNLVGTVENGTATVLMTPPPNGTY